jgi:ankyrin repeat protein
LAFSGGIAERAASAEDFFDLCKTGTAQQIQEAIDAGADVKARNKNGNTVLMHAAGWNSDPEVISVLLKAGADVKARNNSRETALMYASMRNDNPDVVAALLKAGSDVTAFSKNSMTPLLFAARWNKNPAIIPLLVEAGAEINKEKTSGGWTALMVAREYNRKVVPALLKAGAKQ